MVRSFRVRRMAPHQWLCDLPDLSPLTLNYQLEARDLTVRTGLLDPDFASLCSLLWRWTSTAAAGHHTTLPSRLRSTGV